MEELKLYKLLITPDEEDLEFSYVHELGWINEEQFCIWLSYHWIKEFIDELKNIFGNNIFDDGGFSANIQETCICIDLCEAVGHIVDIEKIFPKEKYQH